jgi:group I intron endonuclease
MARKEKKYHFIYKTTNLKNGKFYVGMHSTHNLNDGYLGSGLRLRRSIRRNGIENFKLEILEFLPNRNSLKEREKELVNEDLLKEPNCMNIQPGGGGGWTSEQQRENAIKSNARQRWLRENDKEYNERITKQLKENGSNVLTKLWKEGKLSAPNWTGKQHKEETKLKIGLANSLKQKGEYNSQFGSQWITNGEQNKKIKMMGIVPTGWKLGRTPKK